MILSSGKKSIKPWWNFKYILNTTVLELNFLLLLCQEQSTQKNLTLDKKADVVSYRFYFRKQNKTEFCSRDRNASRILLQSASVLLENGQRHELVYSKATVCILCVSLHVVTLQEQKVSLKAGLAAHWKTAGWTKKGTQQMLLRGEHQCLAKHGAWIAWCLSTLCFSRSIRGSLPYLTVKSQCNTMQLQKATWARAG